MQTDRANWPSAERGKGNWRAPALRIAIIYTIIGALWILFSDLAVSLIGFRPHTEEWVQTGKGWAFILVTGILLYFLIAGMLRSRVKVSDTLLASEERYELAISGADAAIWDWDIVTGDIYWSPRVLTLLGRVPALFSGQNSWKEMLHPDDVPRTLEVLNAHLEKGAIYDVEYRLRAADGSYKWFRARGRAVRDAGGRPIRMSGAINDISERIEATTRLHESEATKRAILDAIPDLIFRIDRDLRVVDYHVPDPTLLSVKPEAFAGRRLSEVSKTVAALAVEDKLRQLFETGEPVTLETVSENQLGLHVWDVRMVLSRTGEAVMIGRNVTEQRAVERRERESRGRLDLLVRNTPLGVIFWDERFHVAAWNPGAQRIFGWRDDEVVGRFWEFIVPDEERAHVAAITEALLSNTGGSRSTNRNIRKDGTIIFCEWYNTPLSDENGRVTAIASVVEDVTERHQTQARQELMLKELDHRVKNNLASVASIAQQTARGAPSINSFVESFTGRIRAMARLHGLLARSHGDNPGGAELGALVRQTLDTFAPGRADRFKADGPRLVLDARVGQALALALNELGTNASKYGAFSTPSGGVAVSWAVQGEGDGRRLSLTWTERGGPEAKAPSRTGFGTELIQGMITHELRGEVAMRYEREGLVCILTAPIGPVVLAGVATG